MSSRNFEVEIADERYFSTVLKQTCTTNSNLHTELPHLSVVDPMLPSAVESADGFVQYWQC